MKFTDRLAAYLRQRLPRSLTRSSSYVALVSPADSSSSHIFVDTGGPCGCSGFGVSGKNNCNNHHCDREHQGRRVRRKSASDSNIVGANNPCTKQTLVMKYL